MKNLTQYFETFYASHYIPIILESPNKELECFCVYKRYSEIYINIRNKFDSYQQFPSVFYSSSLGLFGLLKYNNTKIIIGPVFNKQPNTEEILKFISKTFLKESDTASIVDFINSIPLYNYNQFLNLLTFLEYSINENHISVFDVFFNESRKDDITSIQLNNCFKENETLHGTYFFEQQIIDYISLGDTTGLKDFLIETIKTRNLNEGKLADNELRQAKNILIGSLAYFGKAGAIRGGLPIEDTYQIIDIYTQECERCRTVDEVKNLQYNSLIDLTMKVNKNRKTNQYSNAVNNAIEYLKIHIDTPLDISKLVGYVKISRSSLLQSFKKETGYTIGEYLMNYRLKRAKSLLIYSNKSLSEIAYYLCFSSQSYFQNTFKKAFNITPLHYRKQNQFY